MATAGHCLSEGDGAGYWLDPSDPGYICCNPDSNGDCPEDSVFNVRAWVTTKGYIEQPYFDEFDNPAGINNDGAVLLVEPETPGTNIEPEPLALHTFNGQELPALDITTSGFPCADDRFEGCNATNGLNSKCTVRRGYTIPDALPIEDSNNADGAALVYTGSGCGGHSGGPLSAPVNDGPAAFGMLVAGDIDCTLPGGTSSIYYSQNVDKLQLNGVYVDSLVAAVTAPSPCPPPPPVYDYSGPASVIGTVTERKARRDPHGTTPAPTRPFKRPSRPQLVPQKSGAKQVCDETPKYGNSGPSNTTCLFYMNATSFSWTCTAFFVASDRVVTTGSCISEYGTQEYFVDPSDPGYICCNPDPDDGSCPDNSRFNVVAWVTTKGWFEVADVQEASHNNGAVLLVEPETPGSNIQPEPLTTTTFNGDRLPALDITTRGFPCGDDLFDGCNEDNGIPQSCAQLKDYTVPNALPSFDTNNAAGGYLVYPGSFCYGHDGGPLSAPDSDVPAAFGIMQIGAFADCSSPSAGDGAFSVYAQIVDRSQRYGVYVDSLKLAVKGEDTRRAQPTTAPKAQAPKA